MINGMTNHNIPTVYIIKSSDVALSRGSFDTRWLMILIVNWNSMYVYPTNIFTLTTVILNKI